MANKNDTIIDRLSRLAFTTAIIGVCTIGICPAFGAIGVTVPLVLKAKNAEMSAETISRNKKTLAAGILSLFMFVIDLVIAIAVFGRK